MKISLLTDVLALFCARTVALNYEADTIDSTTESYTAFDSASWGITSSTLSSVLGTDKQPLYDKFLRDCDTAMGKPDSGTCLKHDQIRMAMNRDQPTSVHNYTKAGYAKLKMPTDLYIDLKAFFDDHRQLAEIEWKENNVYHNAWESPPTMVYVNKEEYGGSMEFSAKITSKIQPILEEWTGQRLKPVSTYGIRLYHNGSILTPHVDRMPLITSVILQIDQDVDEPWPLEVYGHDGKGTNVTMVPGDMVLYESHSVIHGRPFPMKGNFFANCFIHFEPLEPIEGESLYDPELDIPPYILSGTQLAKTWIGKNPEGWKGKFIGKADRLEYLRTEVIYGSTERFRALVELDPKDLHEEDDNGWTVLHEAARAGRLDMLKVILEKGIDKDLQTRHRVSPLNIAREYLDEDHELIEYLESIGAKNMSPYLHGQEL